MNRLPSQLLKKIKSKNVVNIETLPLLEKKKIKYKLETIKTREVENKLKLSHKDEWFENMIHDKRDRDLFLL